MFPVFSSLDETREKNYIPLHLKGLQIQQLAVEVTDREPNTSGASEGNCLDALGPQCVMD